MCKPILIPDDYVFLFKFSDASCSLHAECGMMLLTSLIFQYLSTKQSSVRARWSAEVGVSSLATRPARLRFRFGRAPNLTTCCKPSVPQKYTSSSPMIRSVQRAHSPTSLKPQAAEHLECMQLSVGSWRSCLYNYNAFD